MDTDRPRQSAKKKVADIVLRHSRSAVPVYGVDRSSSSLIMSLSLPGTGRLVDAATSFTDGCQSYDEFLASITDRTSEKNPLKFTSADEITRMQMYGNSLLMQMEDMQRDFNVHFSTMKAHFSSVKAATRIEVTSPNGDTILSTDALPVTVHSEGGAAAARGSGLTVKDVTGKLREKVKAWRDEKRAELYQELLDAYEEWFPAVRQAEEPVKGEEDKICREMFRDRVRVRRIRTVQWIRNPDGSMETQSEICLADLEGVLTIQWKGNQDSHIGGVLSWGCVDIKFDFDDPFIASFGSTPFIASSARVTKEGKLAISHSQETEKTDRIDTVLSNRYHSTEAISQEFEFIQGGAKKAEKVRKKIAALTKRMEWDAFAQHRYSYRPRMGQAVMWSTFGLFDEFSKSVDIISLDTLSDGKATEIVKKSEARCEIDHPFLLQFAPWVTLQTPIERVEALPFAGDDGDCVHPALVQHKPLLDLVKDASIAEFGGPGGNIVLRFHAIVAAGASSVAAS